ncbi:MAG: hypothetical protein KY476_22955, partial [Planctomycetes bacterium]|nr:hypothetical protein [Planctomycetota bacterium]
MSFLRNAARQSHASLRRKLTAVFATCVLAAHGGWAAEPDDAGDRVRDEQADGVHAWTSQIMTEIVCRTEGDQPVRLQPTRESLLKWSSPEVGRIYGDVYVWTTKGRPAAIVSLFEWFHPFTGKQAEFVSLSDKPLVAEHERGVLWRAPAADLRWQRLERVGVPHRLANL